MHTIFSGDILFYRLFTCIYQYIEQTYLVHHRRSNKNEKLSKPSFLPSVEHIYLSILICFILNRSENLRNQFCWSWIIFECRYSIWHREYRSLILEYQITSTREPKEYTFFNIIRNVCLDG